MRSNLPAVVAILAYNPFVLASSSLNSANMCQMPATSTNGVNYTDVPLPPCYTCSPSTPSTPYTNRTSPTETFYTRVTSFANFTRPAPTESQTTSTSLSLTQQLLLAETVIDRFNLLRNDSQFVFNFNQHQMGAGDGGELVAANRRTFPALVGTGSGMAIGRVGPCGINTFHVHPRSAELLLVVEGRLITEMAPENGVLNANGSRRIVVNEIGPFQMTPFYQGSIHTQFNPDCTNVTFVASFASEDFGTGQVVDETMDFTSDAIAASFGQVLDDEAIASVRQAVPASIALGVEQCLAQCGMQ